MSPIIIDEIRNALWGCVEIPLYLKRGASRFSGTITALKRSFLIPIIFIPIIIYTIPNTGVYEGKSFDWQASLMLIQIIIGTAAFAAMIYLFKAKHVMADDLRKCLTAYNWLSLSAYVVNVPLILLAVTGINTWDDVFAMMTLVTLYSYSFLAYMIMRVLRVHLFIGVAFALADLMMSEIIRSLTTYFMLHNF